MTSDRDRALDEAARWYTRILEADEPDVEARFDAWLEADPLHVECWAQITGTATVIARTEPIRRSHWTEPFVAREAPPRARTGKTAHRAARRGWRRHVRLKGFAAAAVAACALAVIAPGAMIRLNADMLTATGEVRHVTLADASRVALGPDSAIDVDYTADARTVHLLKGQAWFEVERDPGRPFRVQAEGLTATVLGTGFDVRMIGDTTRVSVAHGRVRVANNSASRLLTAGQWVKAAAGRLTGGNSRPASLGLWRDGEIVARNGSTIASVIDELRPWYSGHIVLASDGLGAQPVAGFYRTDEAVRTIRNLVGPYGGKVTTVTPWLIIVSGG
ncbi:FecR family protein [Altericroceibacterium spongiae]|uniref:FecR family protein n=1 Tax=Altericroceibacterium spongiae TaxID=2320269 RepID=UPI001601AB66|nr:FecR domain-containing protein [Altericroceibacterium spongiae]